MLTGMMPIGSSECKRMLLLERTRSKMSRKVSTNVAKSSVVKHERVSRTETIVADGRDVKTRGATSWFNYRDKRQIRRIEDSDYREPDKNIVFINKVFIKMSADDRRGQQVAHKVCNLLTHK